MIPVDIFAAAAARRSYDEFPLLEPGTDPQLHLSRNTVAQPFFLVCEQDTVLAQMSGAARIEFRRASVNYFDMALGDFVYVPGGTPHRIFPKGESIQIRYKPAAPGFEAVAWYAGTGDEEIGRVTWDCAAELPQDAYRRACTAFNADAKLRTSAASGETLPPIDMEPFGWEAVAKALPRPLPAPRASRGLTIGSPASEKVPLLANAYTAGRAAPTMLLAPLFPYFTPGSIVPCAVMFLASAENRGSFVHHNTVEEVFLCLGAEGAPFPFAGAAFVGPMTHPVGDKPGEEPSQATALFVIAQRQSVGRPQREATIFCCERCGSELFRRDYDAHEFPDPLDGPADKPLIGLPTNSQSAAGALAFNRSIEQRTCRKCGHATPPFPHRFWGWEEYRQRTRAAVRVRKTMMERGAP